MEHYTTKVLGTLSNCYSIGWDLHYSAVAREHFSLAVCPPVPLTMIDGQLSLYFFNSTIIGVK
jgi:hypothetical protein